MAAEARLSKVDGAVTPAESFLLVTFPGKRFRESGPVERPPGHALWPG